MSRRVFFMIFILALVGLGALEFLQYQMGIGRFAENPQTVRLKWFQKAIVGSGRAIVGVVSFNENKVKLDLQCKNVGTRTELRFDDPPQDVGCGIKLRFLGTDTFGAPPDVEQRAILEVSWDE